MVWHLNEREQLYDLLISDEKVDPTAKDNYGLFSAASRGHHTMIGIFSTNFHRIFSEEWTHCDFQKNSWSIQK